MDKDILSIVNAPELPVKRLTEIIKDLQLSTVSSKISQVSMAEIATYMQNVLLRDADQMSMAHALEIRVPFIDYTVVEYVLNVPDKFKYPSSPKKLLVDALGDLLPAEIVNRPKMGFVFPWNQWMKHELKDFCEQRILSLSKRSLFKEQGVIALWKRFLQGDPKITWSRIWLLVVLENWMIENKFS
jgi:asparagine synthase (glutamine-hydrolysing)